MIKSPNLVAWWRMEGNSNDASGNGYNGTDTSMTYGASYGKFGQGADFNGTSSKIVTTINSNLGGNLTFSCWYYLSSLPASGITYPLMTSWVSSYTNYWYSFTIQNGTVSGNVPKFVFNKFDGTNNPYAISAQITSTGWYFLTAVRNNGTLYLYVNSVLINSVTDTTTSVPAYSDFLLGADESATPDYTLGYLDEVMIFNTALTQSQIQSLMMNFSPAEI